MRTITFIIFFSVVLIVYTLANYFIFVRGLQVFSINPLLKKWYIISFWTIAPMFILGNILERTYSSAFSEWIYRMGAFWLAFMLYFLMVMLIMDIVRVFNYFFHFLPQFSPIFKFRFGLIVIGLAAIVVVAGHVNALTINVKEISINISKKVTGSPDVKVLMASDLHLGALIGERREKHLLDIIRDQKPDLVLLCGDLVDGEIAPVLRKNLGKHIQEIKTPLGVYAILGNHEYIGGINKTLPYLESINIRVMTDQATTLPNGIQLIGRNDRSALMGMQVQKPLSELLSLTDVTKPIIVMNHQPFNLQEAAGQGIDLHLSGHTHHGQMWPLNYVTKAIFELSWGFMKKGTTNFYVSSGYGTWGPPVRIGNRPEVVVFNLKFEDR